MNWSAKMKRAGQAIRYNCYIERREISVASPGIEPGSGASETLILSIVLQGQYFKSTVACSWSFVPTMLWGLYYPPDSYREYYEANMSNYLLPCSWSFVPTVLWGLYYPPDSYREYYEAGLV